MKNEIAALFFGGWILRELDIRNITRGQDRAYNLNIIGISTAVSLSIIGFILGLVGLSNIVKFTVPWLVLIYPFIIVLILSALYRKFDRIQKAVVVGMIVALVFGFGDMLSFYGFKGNLISDLVASLPFGSQGIGWILPTIIMMIIAQLITSFILKSDDRNLESRKEV